MVNQEILDYIKRCRAMGVNEGVINEKLSGVGFPKEEIDEAWVEFKKVEEVAKVPAPVAAGANQAYSGKLASFGDILRGSWNFYLSRFSAFILISAVPTMFIMASTYLVRPFVLNVKPPAVGILVGIIFGLFFFFISWLSALAMLYLASGESDWRPTYGRALKNFWSFAWVNIVLFFIILGGAIMAFVPALIFAVWFMFASYVFANEGDRGVAALMKSREYMRGFSSAVIGRMFLLGIIIMVLLFTVRFVSGLAGLGREGVNFIAAVLGIFYNPLAVVFAQTIYKNLSALKPNLAGAQVAGKRGFFIFSGILGAVAVPTLLILGFALSFWATIIGQK